MDLLKIKFYRGIVVSDQELRVLMGRRFIDLWEKWFSIYREIKDYDYSWKKFVLKYDGINCLSKKIGIEINTWPEYSKLFNKKYIIGLFIDEVIGDFNKVIYPPVFSCDNIDKNLYEKLSGYGDCFNTEFHTVIII